MGYVSNYIRSHRLRIILLAGLVAVFTWMVLPRAAHAGILPDLGVVAAIQDGLAHFIGAIFDAIVGIFQFFMSLAGLMFNESVVWSITSFGEKYAKFDEGIIAGWKTFRDVANILIIGLYIFLSFNVILGIKSYGLDKLGVRILIVAFAVNFSMFATLAVIDLSNFLALLFYNAISISGDGIAGAVVQFTGLTGWDTKGMYGLPAADGAWLAAAFKVTILASLLYLAVTAILLYGAILLMTRFVTLIFLILVSAPAIAAYMIPTQHSWTEKWIKLLLNNAIFAPVFMLLLWASFRIMYELTGSVSLRDFVASPNASTLDQLFTVFMVIGLLYASTKIAKELSISGSGFAMKAASVGISTPFAAAGAVMNNVPGLRRIGPDAVRERIRQSAEYARRLPLGAKADAALKGVANSSLRFADSNYRKQLKDKTGIEFGFTSPDPDAHAEYDVRRMTKPWKEEKKKDTPSPVSAGDASQIAAGVDQANTPRQQAAETDNQWIRLSEDATPNNVRGSTQSNLDEQSQRIEEGVGRTRSQQEREQRVESLSRQPLSYKTASALQKESKDAKEEYENLKADGGAKYEKKAAREHLDVIKKAMATQVKNKYAPEGSSSYLKNFADRRAKKMAGDDK